MIKAIIFDWGGVLIDNPANGLMEYCANSLEIKTEVLLVAEKNPFNNIWWCITIRNFF